MALKTAGNIPALNNKKDKSASFPVVVHRESFTLKKLDGTRISKGVTFKKLRLLEPATNYLIERM